MSCRKYVAGAAKSNPFVDAIRRFMALGVAIVALAVVLPVVPSQAENVVYVSPGTNGNCTLSQPCGDIPGAFGFGGVLNDGDFTRVLCINGTDVNNNGFRFAKTSNLKIDIDCPQGFLPQLEFDSDAPNIEMRVRHLVFRHGSTATEILFQSSGTLVFEDCVFTDATGVALDIEPTGPLNLVIRNSRIAFNAGGILLKPQAGGSIKATLDHVVITGNAGGGIKSDSTNGVVNLDVSDSEFSNNGGAGINAIAGSNQNIVSIKNSVFARNGAVGVQANGVNAGVLLQTTLLDQNAAGATSVVSGGNIFTYGNNSIIGSSGSGFTATATLH